MNGAFEVPNSVEAAGYSTAAKARLSLEKNLGWTMDYNLRRDFSILLIL